MKSPEEYFELVNFFAASLATAAAVAIGGSQVGTFVLARREGMMALALPQVVAMGVAIGLREHWPVIWPALGSAILAVIALAWSKRRGANHWVLPSMYIGGLSLSFLLIAKTPEHPHELEHYFTGLDVAVSNETAVVVIPAVLAVGTWTTLLWRRWLAIAQVPAAAELAGLHPARWDVLFLCLMTALLLFGTSALGAVMVLAMLFLPAATVTPWTVRIPTALFASAGLALLFLTAGFVLSVELDWPLSHSVGGAGCAGLVLSHLLAGLVRR